MVGLMAGGDVPLVTLVSLTGHDVAHRLRERLAPLGLELRHYRVLASIGDACGVSQRHLSCELGIPASRVVSIVDALEARGLVARATNPVDRRAHALALTPAGAELLARARKVEAAFDAALAAGLDDTELRQLRRLLSKIAGQGECCEGSR